MKGGRLFLQKMLVQWLLIAGLRVGPATVEVHAAQNEGPAPDEEAAQTIGPAGLPKEVEAMLDELADKVTRQVQRAEVLGRAQRLYREGEALYKKGNPVAAEEHFVRARQAILAADEATFYDPSVHTCFLQLTHQMATLRGIGKPTLASPGQLRIDTNERVQAFVKYFQGTGRNLVRTAYARLGRYEAMMRTIFQKEGVPEDLIYVGLVESAYNPYAVSRAGARGIWQLVGDTGRRYGLKQAGALDERQDPEKSTRAAARYLRDLYEMFDDWPLALAAYNAGERRVLRIIEGTGMKDFWQISSRGLLPEETANYVPSILAAIVVGKQAFEQKPELGPRAAPANSAQTPPGARRVGP